MFLLPKMSLDEVLLYLRKSRTDDPALTVEEVLSRHEQMLDEWTARNLGGRVPEENRFREVVSGETIDSRPEVNRLLRMVESPRYKAILIVEPQRLSRGDLEDIGRLVKLLRYSNTIVITLQYSYDLRDERDRDAFERELKRGNEFLEYQKRIMNNGRLLSVENGNYIGNRPPYGYDKIQIKEGRRRCFTLQPNPEQAPIVRLIFEMYRDGFGSHKIARTLNEMGVPSASGGRWSPESLNKMRTNEHYIGMVFWNHRKAVKTIENGEVVTRRPVSGEYLLFPGKHEPIIDRELWDAVQEIRGKIPPVKARAQCTNPFAGLVYCQCGRMLMRRTYAHSAPRLLCDNQPECGTASCSVSEMEKAVARLLREAVADFELRIKNSASDSAELHRQLIDRLEKRLEELDRREISQWEKYAQEGMPKNIFDQLNEKVLREKDEVMQALCAAKSSVPEPIDYTQKKTMFSAAVSLLEDPNASALKKNMILKKCVDKIIYSRKRKSPGNPRWGEPEPIELDVHLRV